MFHVKHLRMIRLPRSSGQALIGRLPAGLEVAAVLGGGLLDLLSSFPFALPVALCLFCVHLLLGTGLADLDHALHLIREILVQAVMATTGHHNHEETNVTHSLFHDPPQEAAEIAVDYI